MKRKLKTPNGVYTYKRRILYIGIKVINKDIANENLQLLNSIFKKRGIKFGLIYGTLLGAIREKDFISHDEDIDLFILEEYRDKFLDSLFELRKEGFEVVRDDRAGLISIMRKNEYLDFYFFKKYKTGLRICSGLIMHESFFTNTIQYQFKGDYYDIPKDYEDFLVFEYGENWNIPIKYTDFNVSPLKKYLFYIKEYIKDFLPERIFNCIKEKQKVKLLEDFQFKENRLNNYKNKKNNNNL